MHSVDELELRLIDAWNSQNVIDTAINDWRKQLRACAHADGQHFEHLLRARVTDNKKLWTNKVQVTQKDDPLLPNW